MGQRTFLSKVAICLALIVCDTAAARLPCGGCSITGPTISSGGGYSTNLSVVWVILEGGSGSCSGHYPFCVKEKCWVKYSATATKLGGSAQLCLNTDGSENCTSGSTMTINSGGSDPNNPAQRMIMCDDGLSMTFEVGDEHSGFYALCSDCSAVY